VKCSLSQTADTRMFRTGDRTFAGPGMTDGMFAHILPPVRRNQPVIAFCTSDSVEEIIVGRGDYHEGSPWLCFFSQLWKIKTS
jgi:hypothetical protein